MRTVNEDTLALLRRWEGLKLKAYLDVAGIPTIGYGRTKGVALGMRITKDIAEMYLEEDLVEPQRIVDQRVKVPLNDNQFGALVSFAFNVGTGAFASSTLLRKLNAGDYDAVPGELMRWNKAKVNGKMVPVEGLVNRRAAEIGLWSRGSPVTSNTLDVRPDPRPPGKDDLTAGGGALTSATTVMGALSEHSDQIQQVSWFLTGKGIISIIAGVVFVCCLIYLFWNWLQRRKG